MARQHLTPPRPVLSIVLATLVTLVGVVPIAPAAAAGPPAPSTAPTDEVRLPSGGFVRGEIQALMPGEYVEIRKHDGKIQRFEWNEIQSIVRADGTVIARDSVTAPTPDSGPAPFGDDEPELGDGSSADAAQPVDGTAPAAQPADAPVAVPPGYAPDGTQGPVISPGPTVKIVVNREGPTVSLFRLGNASRALCDAPCNEPIKPGYLYVASSGKRLGLGFELTEDAPAYQVDVKRSSPLRKWGGLALIPVGLVVGIGIGIIPVRHNVPQAKVAGYAVGGTLIGLAGIGGGVTLMMFSRSKVEVFPQTDR